MSRFPFISCEIFTCEIDVILKTVVEEEEVFHFILDYASLVMDIAMILFQWFSLCCS